GCACLVTTPIPEVLTYFRSPRRSQPVWELQLASGLQPAGKTRRRDPPERPPERRGPARREAEAGRRRVELRGLEPLTPTLPVWAATRCALAPSRCPSKLHHTTVGFKTGGQGTSPPASGPSGRASVCSVDRRGRVSGASTQPTAAIARNAPLMTNAQPNDACSAIWPTISDPMIEPKSAIIWNVATAVPPRDLLPTTSATAACCGATKMPVAAPAM